MPRPVIIDCDPGHDDAIALLLAFASKDLEVKAVTTVAGNQTLPKTLNNALKVLDFAGIDAEVAAGAAKPMVRDLIIAPQVHGESGLDGPVLPEPSLRPSNRTAFEAITDIIRKSKDKVTIIPVGPLTNIAIAMLAAPDILANIERIILMGGAALGGNWTPSAEFNILVDPEAARVVMKSGVPITMIGLDVTHKALIYEEDVKALYGMDRRVATLVAELLEFFMKFHSHIGFSGAPLHDPVAVAAAIDPTIVKCQRLPVDIECHGELTTGRTVVTWPDSNRGKVPGNVDVALDLDRDRFVGMLMEAIKAYD